MAKIKIKGLRELVSVPNEVAEKIKEKLEDERVPNNYLIALEKMSFRKGDIAVIILENLKENYKGAEWIRENNRRYFREREELLEKSPSEKAKLSVEEFKLFYRMCFGKELKDCDLELNALKAAEKFYQENPLRTIVSPRIWAEVLGFREEIPIRGLLGQAVYRIFQRLVVNEVMIIEREKFEK